MRELKMFRYYAIVAPRVVRPNSEYHVAVSIVGVSEPTTTFVELSGQLDSGESFAVSENIVVEPYATRLLNLEVRYFFLYYRRLKNKWKT